MDFKKVPDSTKGIIFIIIGIIILIDALGIFKESLYYGIVLGALILIGYGIVLSGYWEKIQSLLKSDTKKQ